MRLSDLKFVVGAVARKDYDERLCHLEIKDGRATADGGRIAMSTPIDADMHIRPHAKSLVKAVQACGDDPIGIAETGTGRLSLRAGKFKAFIDCLPKEQEMTQLMPSGAYFDVTDELLHSIVALAPLMSIDASRPWAQGLRIDAHSTYATNNIIVAQRWHGAGFPRTVIIPADAVHELIRIDERPRGVQVSEHSLTFFFENNRWLCTRLIAMEGGWDRADEIFERNTNTDGLENVPDGLYDALDTLKPFFDDAGKIYMLGDRIATSRNDNEGASVDITVATGPIFHASQLRLLQNVATKVNFKAYPKPCYFIGDKLRGVIVGMRE